MNHDTITHGPTLSLRFWFSLTLSAALIALLLWMLDVRQIAAHLAGVNIGLALLALAICCAAMLYSGLRWWLLVRVNNPDVPLSAAVRIAFVSALIGGFLPGVVGVEVIRVAGMARVTSNMAGAFTSVLLDRLLGVAGLVLLVLVGLALAPHTFDPSLRMAAWLTMAALGLTAAALLSPRMQRLALRLVPSRAHRWVYAPLQRIVLSLETYRGRPGQLALSAALAIGAQLIRVLIIAVCAWAMHLSFPPLMLLIIVPILLFAEMLPISVAGLGVSQVSYVYLFGLLGIEAEAAFAVSMLYLLTGTAALLPGAFMINVGGKPGAAAVEEPDAKPQAAET